MRRFNKYDLEAYRDAGHPLGKSNKGLAKWLAYYSPGTLARYLPVMYEALQTIYNERIGFLPKAK